MSKANPNINLSRHGASREGSASSGRRRKDYWYYESSPSKQDEVVLDSRLRPRPGNERLDVLAEPRNYRNVKRELSEGSSSSERVAKIHKTSSLTVEGFQRKPMRDSSTLSYETESSVSVAKSRHHDSGVLKNPSEEQDRRYKGRQTPEPSILMRSNTLLRREINLLNVHRDEKIADLEGTITHLQEVNKNLNAMMSRFRDMERVRANQSGGPLAEVKSLVAKLKEKDEELENKIDQITSLEEQLSARNRLENIYDDMKSNLGCTSSFSKGLAELEEGAHQLAGFLVQCLSNKRIQNLRKKPQRQRELSEFITSILGRIGLLITDPNACMRALIFSFMRERIFMSNCWTTLHFEGYMLRELQDIIQKMCPRNTLQSLHKAAIESMFSRSSEFEQCWIRTQVEDHRDQFLELLSPLFDHRELEDMRYQLERDLELLFTRAFKTRSRFFAPTGVRFELVQFKPGTTFNADYMRVQEEPMTTLASPGDKIYCIKACIHGCLLKHSKKEPIDEDEIKMLSQPFIASETSQSTISGNLMSDKAVVILED